MAGENEKVKIVVPWWPGPIGDEWDSGGYNDFWGPAQRSVQRQVDEAKLAGKEIELVAPENSVTDKKP